MISFKPLSLLLGFALLSGCAAPLSLSGGGPSAKLTLQPTIRHGDFHLQSLVEAYEASDIKVLRVTLSKLNGTASTPIKDADGKAVEKDIPGERLDATIVFGNLSFDTTYRVHAFAYADLAKTVLISSEEGSYVDLEVERNDRPELRPLPVQLIDQRFRSGNGIPLSVTDGQFITSPESVASAYRVSTLSGKAGETGSADGYGNEARFKEPVGIAVDGAGNLYVADKSNDSIRKITPQGMVTTLAGMAGQQGSTDGHGREARFNYPTGIAVGGAGNLYVTDALNATIRKITPEGSVTTFAGKAGAEGSTDSTDGEEARFNYPAGIAADGAGNLYVADNNNHTIRKITPQGAVTTLAGMAGQQGSTDGKGNAARFHNPLGIAMDTAGNLYVADGGNYENPNVSEIGNHTIRKISPQGAVTTIAGRAGERGSTDSPDGKAARFEVPNGIAVDTLGNLYVADSFNHTIRKLQ